MKHLSSPLLSTLTRLRDRLVPEALGLGWMPIFLLGYLVFLFVPVLVPSNADWGEGVRWYLWPTLASIAVFLPMYFLAYRGSALARVLCTLGIDQTFSQCRSYRLRNLHIFSLLPPCSGQTPASPSPAGISHSFSKSLLCALA